MEEKTFDLDQHLYYCSTQEEYDGHFEDWDRPWVAYIEGNPHLSYCPVQ